MTTCTHSYSIGVDHEAEKEAEVVKEEQEVAIDNSKPLVCYEIERDLLRQMLIDWLKSKVVAPGWFTDGKNL